MRLMCLAVPGCWGTRGHTMPGPCQGQPQLSVTLSSQCLCLQAVRRGLLHPVRVLAGRHLVEKVGQVHVWGWGLRGVAHCSLSLPSLSHCSALCALGPFVAHRGEHPNKGFGEQGRSRDWCWGSRSFPVPVCEQRVPAPHPPDPTPCFTATCSPAAARPSSSPSSACWSPRSC